MTKKLAAENRQLAATGMRTSGGLVWLDNFNKFRYARNVNEDRSRCINGAVMSVLPLAGLQRDLFGGWLPLHHLMSKLHEFPSQVIRAQKNVANEVKTLQQSPLTFAQVQSRAIFAGPALPIWGGFLGLCTRTTLALPWDW